MGFMFLILFPIGIITVSSQYLFVPRSLSWADAENYCINQCNSHLVSIHSLEEHNDIVNKYLNPYKSYINSQGFTLWIGLALLDTAGTGALSWTDGTNFTYGSNVTGGIDSWSYGEPTLANSANCVYLDPFDAYQWHDEECWYADYFICNNCEYNNHSSVRPYSIIPSRVDIFTANYYCTNHCNSQLASISNEIDMQRIVYLAEHTPKYDDAAVYIGLYDRGWLDSEPVIYGSSPYIYPWEDSQPEYLESCAIMSSQYGYPYLWDDVPCSRYQRFVCNSCDAKLNKYITRELWGSHWNYAKSSCNTDFGTTLASIHNNNDLDEIIQLIQTSTIYTDSWIGLSDLDGLDTYRWTDGTQITYISNISGGAFPWAPHQPDSNVHRCVTIEESNGRLYDSNCTVQKRWICQAPSLFCYDSYWTILQGIWSFTGCNDYSFTATSFNLNGVLISDKQWINNNGIFVLEFTFSTTFSVSAIGVGTVEIMIFNYIDTMCKYLYVSITSGGALSLHKMDKGISTLITKTVIDYSHGIYNILRIQISRSTNINFQISWNNNDVINTNQSADTSLIDSSLSGYIGLKTSSINLNAKYLYVSGAIWNVNGKGVISDYGLCTLSPTAIPTSTPTINQTRNPSSNPTTSPIKTADPTTSVPTSDPTNIPTNIPTDVPTNVPTANIPTSSPTNVPTNVPSNIPSNVPTRLPLSDALFPTTAPTDIISFPTNIPTILPSVIQSNYPTNIPTISPSDIPTADITETTETIATTEQTNKGDNNQDANNSDNASNDGLLTIIFIACGAILLCLCCIFILYCIGRRKRKKLNNIQDVKVPNIVAMQSLASITTDNAPTPVVIPDDDHNKQNLFNTITPKPKSPKKDNIDITLINEYNRENGDDDEDEDVMEYINDNLNVTKGGPDGNQNIDTVNDDNAENEQFINTSGNIVNDDNNLMIGNTPQYPDDVDNLDVDAYTPPPPPPPSSGMSGEGSDENILTEMNVTAGV